MQRHVPTLLYAALLASFPAWAEQTLAPIHVHAEKDDFEARKDATSTRLVYGREELDRMNELTVGDYLRRLPSVNFTGPPGTPKDVRVRGMDKGYTEILIDGEPVATGTKERQIQVDRIPLDMVERIELIRAPSAAMPNEGLMGTLNIVLRDAPQARVASARLVAGRVSGEKTDKDIVVAAKKGVWVETRDGWHKALDSDAWNAHALPDGAVVVAVKEAGLPSSRDGKNWESVPGIAAALEALPGSKVRERITLGKLMIDLHTGKALFGKQLEWIWIYTLGVVWVFLGFTGLWLWWRSQTRRRDAAYGKLAAGSARG